MEEPEAALAPLAAMEESWQQSHGDSFDSVSIKSH